jgi:hypothetical protein
MEKKYADMEIRGYHITSCLFCNRQLTKNVELRQGLCLDCMAFLVENIDIDPDDDYPLFIDFAYKAKERLHTSETAESIFENAPEGFGEWLLHNTKKIEIQYLTGHSSLLPK